MATSSQPAVSPEDGAHVRAELIRTVMIVQGVVLAVILLALAAWQTGVYHKALVAGVPHDAAVRSMAMTLGGLYAGMVVLFALFVAAIFWAMRKAQTFADMLADRAAKSS
jgi:hypothetical protein